MKTAALCLLIVSLTSGVAVGQVPEMYRAQMPCNSGLEEGDPTGAVNSAWIVQKVNKCIAFTSRSTNQTTAKADYTFWGTPSTSPRGDGVVYWDALSQHWFYAERSLEGGIVGVGIGYSTGTDPTSIVSTFYAVGSGPDFSCGNSDCGRADQPQLGFNDTFVVLSVQRWSSSAQPLLAVWLKTNFLAGKFATLTTRNDLVLTCPCETQEPGVPEYFVRNDNAKATGITDFFVTALSGNPNTYSWVDKAGQPTTTSALAWNEFDQVDLPGGSVSKQPGSSVPVINDAKRSRFHSCVESHQTIFAAHNVAVTAPTSLLNADSSFQPSFVGYTNTENEAVGPPFTFNVVSPAGTQPGDVIYAITSGATKLHRHRFL